MKELTIEEIIIKIAELRKVPQFLFSSGVHTVSMINVRDAILQKKKQGDSMQEIDFIVNSAGGSPADAYRIIRTLRKNYTTVNIIIPFWAKSAATLLSLGGTNIIMDEFAEFGPLDIQLPKERDDSPDFERESALNDEHSLKRIEARSLELYYSMFTSLYSSENIPIHKNELSKQILDFLAKFYEPLLQQINPYKLGDKRRKLAIGEQYASKVLTIFNRELSENDRILLIDYLINGCPDHGYVIDYDLMASFLPNVQKTNIFGTEYEELVSLLSGYFINLLVSGQFNSLIYVGFIEKSPEELVAENELNAQEERLNNTTDALSPNSHHHEPSKQIIE